MACNGGMWWRECSSGNVVVVGVGQLLGMYLVRYSYFFP